MERRTILAIARPDPNTLAQLQASNNAATGDEYADDKTIEKLALEYLSELERTAKGTGPEAEKARRRIAAIEDDTHEGNSK